MCPITEAYLNSLSNAQAEVRSWNEDLTYEEQKVEVLELMCDATDKLIERFGNTDEVWDKIYRLNNTHLI